MLKNYYIFVMTTILSNKMKSYLSFFLVVFTISISLSQNSSISGVVMDKETGETIPMANILLKQQTETIINGISSKVLIQGSVSNINGDFVIENINPGEYILECSFIGYKTYKKTIKLKSTENKYVTISITEESNLLGDVVISAGKFEQN